MSNKYTLIKKNKATNPRKRNNATHLILMWLDK